MKRNLVVVLVLLAFLTINAQPGCSNDEPISASGVSKATVKVQTNPSGLTTEQQNIRDRLIEDNKPGAIKHLYVISAYSGQVIIYSTVRGKVTSGGKRLTPTTVNNADESRGFGFPVKIGNYQAYTEEVLQDDGSYGTSDPYIYWWDTKGVYHQHFISGGQIIHISDQPLVVKGIIINMELTQDQTAGN